MLIDLIWTKNHIRSNYLKSFTADKGNLTISYKYGVKVYTHPIARRISTGIYRARDLSNNIQFYTDWNVANPIEESQRLLNVLLALTDGPEKEEFRKKFFRQHSEYGMADNLKQILHYGRGFINSDKPYALGICEYDGEMSFSNGPYIGNKNEPDTVLRFEFCQLTPKESYVQV